MQEYESQGGTNLKKTIMMVMICVLSITLLATYAQAYSLIGGKQKTKNIVYQINSSLTSGYHSSLANAMTAWDSATTLTFTKKSSTTQKVQIYVNGKDFGKTDWNAQATNYRDWVFGGDYANSVIDANYYYMKDMTSGIRQGVFAHEIGHTLGLGHVTDTTQVMSTSKMGRSVNKPGTDDINGIKAIYK